MKTALIVDDLAENLYFLRCLLSSAGYQIVEARNGVEALACAKEQRIDLVVSDILMPGMDGFSLCRQWRNDKDLRGIPFIFYTATYTDARDGEFALSLGADDFIVKPIEPRILMQRIQDVTSRPPAAVTPVDATRGVDSPYLQRYNEVLIRKLEEKVVELEQANRALRLKDLAIATSVSGILFADVNGIVSYANPAMANLCLPRVRVLPGVALDGLLDLPLDWSEWVQRGQGGRQFETRLKHDLDARPSPLLRVSAHCIGTEDNQHLGVMLSCLDVSEEARLRTELARVQRLEALSLFAAGVAHDFNNLLMGMFAALEFEPLPGEAASVSDEYRSMALAAFERAKHLTRRLLTFSKGNRTSKRTVDLCQLLDDEITLALSGSGVTCVKRYAAHPATVEADAGQLAQVFNNLLVNARQAMADQGTLVICIERSSSVCDATDPGLAEGEILVKVTDNGAGISQETLPRIFEPYFTTKPEGSGLGLATSHAIIQQHGGRIEVESSPGRGATFSVYLPRGTPIAAPPRVGAHAESRRGSGRILVMDEQILIQALLQRTLERHGYSVVAVSNGDQAILEFDRASSAGVPFELLILDVTVRGAMGGIEALRNVRTKGHDVPAIAATGYSDELTASALKESGFIQVLGKPFLIHELLSVVEAVIGTGVSSKQSEAEAPRTGNDKTEAASR